MLSRAYFAGTRPKEARNLTYWNMNRGNLKLIYKL
jgi:hypothetical protein